MSVLQLAEQTMNITMTYDGKHGNKGFDITDNDIVHNVDVYSSVPKYEVVSEISKGGPVPIVTEIGLKVPVITLDGYFPYRFPTDFFDVFMPTLASRRKVNTVKNIFLVQSILTVVSNGNGIMSEFPIGSKWYVKKYTWKRDTNSPQLGGFNLVLWRWFKE